MFKRLWKRTKYVASTYTGTFIAVMLLNQLVFFGFCLNPICLIAAMPHVLAITVAVGSWLNHHSNWGGGEDTQVDVLAETPPTLQDAPKTSVGVLANDALTKLNAGLDRADNRLRSYNVRQSAKNEYLKEKMFIDAVLGSSEKTVTLNKKLEADPEFAKHFQSAMDNWKASEEKTKIRNEPSPLRSKIADIIVPEGLDETENANEIRADIAKMSVAHVQYLTSVKQKLDRDPALTAVFMERMKENGAENIFIYLMAIGLKRKPARPKSLVPIKPRHLSAISPKQSPPKQEITIAKSDQAAGLYGSLSLELVGNWTGGYTCDVHTVSSNRVGQNKHGQAVYDTTRSEMGQLVYELKYANDFSTIPNIIKLLRREIMIEGFDCIIPVPASKVRQRQPVDAIAQALAEHLKIPVLVGFLRKSTGTELKGLVDSNARNAVLRDSISAVGLQGVTGRSVLLIDDLYRSGGTLRACSDTLKKRGAGEIWVLTMTKTRQAT